MVQGAFVSKSGFLMPGEDGGGRGKGWLLNQLVVVVRGDELLGLLVSRTISTGSSNRGTANARVRRPCTEPLRRATCQKRVYLHQVTPMGHGCTEQVEPIQMCWSWPSCQGKSPRGNPATGKDDNTICTEKHSCAHLRAGLPSDQEGPIPCPLFASVNTLKLSHLWRLLHDRQA